MATIDDILEDHAFALESLTDREAEQFVKTYKSVARELSNKIAHARSPDAAQRARIMLAQVGTGIVELEERLNGTLGSSLNKTRRLGLKNLATTIRAAEPALGETVGMIEVGALRRLHQGGLALHEHSIKSYGTAVADALQRDIVRATAMGEGVDAMEKRLRKTLLGSRLESRAWLIARMELSRAYNDTELAGIEEADETLPGGMLKKIHEAKDGRNHPFSRASNGITAKADQPFRVPVAAVRAAGIAMKKGVGGILWDQKGGNYVGMNLPAHFGERGRIVPWRESWGEPSEAEKARKKAEEEAARKAEEEKEKEKKRKKRLAASARIRAAARDKQRAQKATAKKVTTFKDAKKELKAAEEAAKALGIADPHRYAESYAQEKKLLEDTKAMAAANPTMRGFFLKKKGKFDARERVTKAYRKASDAAPRKWREKERARWGSAMIKRGPRISPRHRERYDRNLNTAFQGYRPDQLRLLYADNEEIRHLAGHPRAFASMRQFGEAGYVKIDLRELASGGPHAQSTAVDTLAHELGHRLDGLFGGTTQGQTGYPWKSRAGYPGMAQKWRRAYGNPYQKAKTGGFHKMPHKESHSPFQWAGNFVNPYEARVYSRKSLSQLEAAGAALDGGEGGPIEFIAMANGYRAEERFRIRHALKRSTRQAVIDDDTERVWRQLFDAGPVRVAARKYGPAYRDALEDLYGDGLRMAEEVAEKAYWGPPGVERDKDLTASALFIQSRLGGPLDQYLGPGSPFGKLLSKPANLQQVKPLPVHRVPWEEDHRALKRIGGGMFRSFDDVSKIIEGETP